MNGGENWGSSEEIEAREKRALEILSFTNEINYLNEN